MKEYKEYPELGYTREMLLDEIFPIRNDEYYKKRIEENKFNDKLMMLNAIINYKEISKLKKN